MISVVALTDLLGRPVLDHDGGAVGRLRDLAIVPKDHPTHVAYLVVGRGQDERYMPATCLGSIVGATLRLCEAPDSAGPSDADYVLLLQRDLLDQQIIDVQGRKVVRVNDIELEAQPGTPRTRLSVRAVDVGARGAVRRLCQGIVPRHSLRTIVMRIPSRTIPWGLVDLLEKDPGRRVHLKISYQGLSTLHPADIANIVEHLPADEREAVFETLDETVAAAALEELDRDTQIAVVESLDSDRAADIVEEMGPDAAADLLGDLPEEQSGAILEEMEPADRAQIRELLAFGEHTAAGRMTTEFLAMPADASSAGVVEALRQFEGGMEALATIYLVSAEGELSGAVPLARAVSAPLGTELRRLSAEVPVSCDVDTPDEQVAALFDKYNLLTLPVVDEHRRLAGIITADDIISLLRGRE